MVMVSVVHHHIYVGPDTHCLNEDISISKDNQEDCDSFLETRKMVMKLWFRISGSV